MLATLLLSPGRSPVPGGHSGPKNFCPKISTSACGKPFCRASPSGGGKSTQHELHSQAELGGASGCKKSGRRGPIDCTPPRQPVVGRTGRTLKRLRASPPLPVNQPALRANMALRAMALALRAKLPVALRANMALRAMALALRATALALRAKVALALRAKVALALRASPTPRALKLRD